MGVSDRLRSGSSSPSSGSVSSRLKKKVEERPVRPTRIMETPDYDITESPLIKKIQTKQVEPVKTRRDKQIESTRKLPVIGPALKGLDYVAEKTEPVAEVMRSFYMPGAGLSNIAGLTGAAESAVARIAPKLANTIGGRIAQKGISEAVVGAPLGAAQTQMINPDASVGELAKGAVVGAALGGGLGSLGKGVTEALRYGKSSAQSLAGNAIKNVAENKRTVNSPFVQGAVENPIARGYTENVGRSFGSRPTRVVDIDEVIEPPAAAQQAHNMAARSDSPEVTPQVRGSAGQPTPRQPGIRANYQTQLEHGNFSPELQQRINATDQSYDIATNAASLEAANKRLQNLPKAESDFLLNKEGGAEHTATGYRLMQELDAIGEHERALIVADKLAADLTKQGQGSQAAIILSRLSPEGQLLNLIRTAKKSGKEVSVKDSTEFKELAAEVQQKSGAGIHANQFNEIVDRIERGESVSPNDMVNLANFLSRAGKVVTPKKAAERLPRTTNKVKPPADEVPKELKNPRKREKIVNFLDEAEQAALSRIAARKNRLNSLPIDEWQDHIIVVASQLAKGTIKAATYAEDLVRLFGEDIRPVADQVFKKAQGLVKGVSRGAEKDNMDRANAVLRKLSGEAEKEKEAVKIMGEHVKKLIADAKAGTLTPSEVQKLRDYSDEITEMLANKKPSRVPTQEEKFLQSVKSLAKKIKEVETEKVEPEQANREISNLIRQVTKISEGETPRIKPDEKLNQALSDIAHDVMNETRPTPKPTTLQEKIVEKYIKSNENVTPEDIKVLRQLAKDTARLSTDQKVDADIAMQKILNSYEKSSLWDKTLAIRYIGMLLNSHTQLINALSGPFMSTTGYLADVLGTMVDIVMSKKLNKPRSTTLYGSNPLQFMARYMKNLKTGARAGWHGVNPAGIQSTNEIRGLAFPGKYNPLGIAERTLGAVAKGADYATYKSVYDSEIVKQGFLDAKNQGITGKANIQRHIDSFVNNPPESALIQADNIGKNTTFQRSDTTGGKLANFLNTSPNVVKPVVNAIFPFVRTPVNIASTAVTLTPLGIIKGLYQLTSKSPASQREAIRTLSLGLTGGAGLSALGYYLQSIGVITGANDTGDKDVNNIKDQAGMGKYRFNTSALSRYLEAMWNGDGSEAAEQAAQYQEGDSAFDYNKLQPLAFPAAIGASLSENKGKPVLEQVGKSAEDAYGSLYGMSTLKGVQDVFQPSYGGTIGEKALGTPMRIAESFFKSFSPSALAQEARRQDPIQRKVAYNEGFVKDVGDYFKSRTPGLSQSLPPNKTTLGQNKMNAPGIRGQYLNPYREEIAPYNDAAKIISDLINATGDKTLAPSAPDKNVRGKDKKGQPVSMAIPTERYAKMQEEVGNEIIKKIMALSPTLTPAKKAEKLKDIYSVARERARNKVKKELGVR